MQRLLMVLSIVALGVASCAVDQDNKVVESPVVREQTTEVDEVALAPPGPLDDEWSRWLVGEWEVFAESDIEGYKRWVRGAGMMNAEMGLRDQFLIIRKEGRITRISDEYLRHLKHDLHTSDEEIEALQSMTFGDIELHSINPHNGRLVAYLFDSWRCVAEGTGTRGGNREVIEWEWSLAGGGTSVRTTARTGDNKLTVVEKYTLPDGSTMEDRIRMIRKRPLPSDSGSLASLVTR